MPSIELPNNWWPRKHQRNAWRYLQNGGRHAVLVWHRRAGKDNLALNRTALAAHERVGVYWHMLPEASQARKALWDGIDDRTGIRFIDQAFPMELRAATNQQEMKITLKCGSIWQVVGSDNYDSLVGSNPIGVVHSEYAIADPAAREFLRPILAANNGWEIYCYTPRGKNHGYKLYQMAKANPDWYAELLTVDETGLVPESVLDAERDAGMPEEMIRQEYFCSFNAPMLGSYYGAELEAAEADGRIVNVPYDPAIPVETWWDLGVGDDTAIWFVQYVGKEIHVIDYYESNGVGLDHYAKVLRERNYLYDRHVAPHDMAAREFTTGKTRVEAAYKLGLNFEVAPRLPIEDGINAVRSLISRCWFDVRKCGPAVEKLGLYHREYDDRNLCYRDRPVHDYTSHCADAFRTGATMEKRRAPKGFNRVLVYPKGRVA